MKWGEQARVLRLIPGLEQAEFVRFGMIHRNTYVNAPTVLRETWQTRMRDDLFFAGQMSGVEGYVESAASGLMAGRNAAALALGEAPSAPPRTTAHRRAGLLRLPRGSETLRAVEHRVRPDAGARAAGRRARRIASWRFSERALKDLRRVVREHLKAFLEHLRLNENASAHTVRAYEQRSLAVPRLSGVASQPPRQSDAVAADLDHLNARAFLGDPASARATPRRRRRESCRRSARSAAIYAAKGVLERRSGGARRHAEARAADPGASRGRRDVEAAGDARTRRRRSAGATRRSWSCSMRPACD